jgi:hypothetical protein
MKEEDYRARKTEQDNTITDEEEKKEAEQKGLTTLA